MKRTWLPRAIVLCALLASCGGTVAGSVTTSGTTDARVATAPPAQPQGVPSRPPGEVKVGTPDVPSGVTPLSLTSIGTGIVIGGMLVLPPGSVPSNWQARTALGPGVVRREVGGTRPEPANNIARHSVPVPAGFTLSDDGAVLAASPDGTQRTIEEYYQLFSDSQWPVDIDITAIAPAAKPEVIAYDGQTGRTLGIYRHQGIDAIVVYNAPGATLQIVSEADFVIGSFLFHVRAPGLPSSILIAIVDGFVDLNR